MDFLGFYTFQNYLEIFGWMTCWPCSRNMFARYRLIKIEFADILMFSMFLADSISDGTSSAGFGE